MTFYYIFKNRDGSLEYVTGLKASSRTKALQKWADNNFPEETGVEKRGEFGQGNHTVLTMNELDKGALDLSIKRTGGLF